MVLRAILRGPPVAQTSACIVNIAEFVEAVADLVGHAGAGRTVVGSGVALGVKIRRLQNGGREKLGVRTEHDHRTGSLRMDRPLNRIDRLF